MSCVSTESRPEMGKSSHESLTFEKPGNNRVLLLCSKDSSCNAERRKRNVFDSWKKKRNERLEKRKNNVDEIKRKPNDATIVSHSDLFSLLHFHHFSSRSSSPSSARSAETSNGIRESPRRCDHSSWPSALRSDR